MSLVRQGKLSLLYYRTRKYGAFSLEALCFHFCSPYSQARRLFFAKFRTSFVFTTCVRHGKLNLTLFGGGAPIREHLTAWRSTHLVRSKHFSLVSGGGTPVRKKRSPGDQPHLVRQISFHDRWCNTTPEQLTAWRSNALGTSKKHFTFGGDAEPLFLTRF